MPQSKPKVLYVDALSFPMARSNTQGIVNAYAKVADVHTFDYRSMVPPQRRKGQSGAIRAMNRALLEKAIEVQPDFVHLGKCETVKGKTVAAIKEETGAVVHQFYGDYRAAPQPYVIDIGRHADMTLLHHKDERVYARHRDSGCRKVGFWWAGTDVDVFKPYDVPVEYELIMMCNRFGSRMAGVRAGQGDRYSFALDLARAGLQVYLFGHKNGAVAQHHPNLHARGFVDLGNFARACSASKIALNYSSKDIYMYCSWRRVFNTMASGCMLLTRYFPGLDTVFTNHEHLVWFDEDEEAVELIRLYLKDDQARQRIAGAGRAEVVARHTWDHRIHLMLEMAGLL